jgi:hypothetical protein
MHVARYPHRDASVKIEIAFTEARNTARHANVSTFQTLSQSSSCKKLLQIQALRYERRASEMHAKCYQILSDI